jgi:phospholipid/cholesterol/gamma-HCH transport system substrate-binding protein
MQESRTELQVGVALVAALLTLVFGLMWFEDYQLNVDYQAIHARFPNVGGLGVGDPVDVRGIKMGTVSRIDLGESGVLVEFRLRQDVRMREDAVLKIGSAGIMGERMVAVEPGAGVPVGEDHVFVGSYEAAPTDLVGQLEQFNVAVMGFLGHADSLLIDLRKDDKLVHAVEGASAATESLNTVMAENRDDLRKIASNTASLTDRLDRFLADHEENLAAGAAGMARAASSLDTLSRQLGSVLAGTEDIITALKNEEGPAGKMIFDEQAGENLVQTLEKLRFLVEDLQRNPERYLTVKIF